MLDRAITALDCIITAPYQNYSAELATRYERIAMRDVQ